ncbi:MAG: efflux transporter outer membrane subunit [Chlamydiales bacterium]
MVGPNYYPPCIEEQVWFEPETDNVNDEPIVIDWWNTFQDPILTALIEDVIRGNLSLKIAQERILEARALRGIAFAPLFPWIGANASYTTFQDSLNSPGGEPFFVAQGIAERRNEVYDANFDAFWELDIFGGKRRALQAANARLGSSIASKRDVLLSAIAETARNYFELRGFQKRLYLLNKNATLQENTLDLVKKKNAIGLAREVDVTRAKALLENTRSQIPDLEADLQATSYRISVLTGRDPLALNTFLKEERPLLIPEDVIPIGLRSDVLRRRPDVQFAEREFAAATADIGVAIAKLFPSFTLTGDYGFLSAGTLGNLFTPRSETWIFNGLIHFPIFEGGRLLANVHLQQALQSQAGIEYCRTILLALEDAEGAIIRYSKERETRQRRQEEVKAAKKSVQLLRSLYQKGLTDFLDVLLAEREQTSAEDNLAQSETRVLTQLVSLYKSLGGGWESFECSEINQNQTR